MMGAESSATVINCTQLIKLGFAGHPKRLQVLSITPQGPFGGQFVTELFRRTSAKVNTPPGQFTTTGKPVNDGLIDEPQDTRASGGQNMVGLRIDGVVVGGNVCVVGGNVGNV